MNRDRTFRLMGAVAVAAILARGGIAGAVEPTHLEPAEELTPHTFELEEELEYVDSDDSVFEAETEISYSLNRRLKIGLMAPFEHEDGEGTEFGDAGVFLEGVLNPDSPQRFLLGGELELQFPTGEDSDHVGGEIQLRMSKYLGEEDKNGLHANVFGYFNTEDEDDEHGYFNLFRRFRDDEDEYGDDASFGAALGYTHAATANTTLVADVYYRQDYEGGDDAVMGELGVSHDFNDAFSAGIGVGAGLTSDSPDFEARIAFSFKFGGKRRAH